MKNILKVLHKSTIITPIIFAATIIFITLFFYVPYITEKNSIKMATKHSITSVEQIKLTRAYYVDSVVKDVKKYAPQLEFSYDHKGVNGKIPLPTTTIHDLSAIFSDNSGLKYNLYSDYPFAFKKQRILTPFQKEALQQTNKTDDGLYVKKDIIDGKPVLRVAVTDFMTDKACVECHNTHPERTWEKEKWKLGDKRGVIEVITPLEDEIASNIAVRNNILIFISIIGFFLLVFLSYTLLRREKQLLDANDELTEDFKNLYKDFDKNVIASTTNPDGIITYASDRFCTLSGYSKDELVGCNHNIIRHPDMDKKIFETMWDTIQDGKVWRGDVKNLKKDGGFYWVDAIISPVFDENQNIIEYTAIRQDITNNIEIEDINKNLEEKISQAIKETKEKEQHMLNQSKMAQMGEMLSMIAHQWRQPLTAISSTASTLELKIILDSYDKDFFQKSIKDIQSYSQHLSLTINDFRNFFRDSKTINQTTFQKIIDDVLNIIQVSVENKNISLSVINDFKNDIYIYENEFKQVVLNLIKNAEDAILEKSPKNTYIKIRTYSDEEKNAIFEIEDSGGGISQEIIKDIFKPYFSTKDEKNGTGLGLYMSKIIIENHCLGSIECLNTEDGAIFRIKIDTMKLS